MLLEYNLQFFAQEGPGGEKTEPATEKKLSDARKEGQVAKSREVANGLGLLGLFILLKFYTGTMGTQFLSLFESTYNRMPEIVTFWNGYMSWRDVELVLFNMLLQIIIIVGPIFLVGFAIAFFSDVIQVKWVVSAKPLMPKLNKLNPLSGFKRMFSSSSVMELVKSLAKIIIILVICYSYLKDQWQNLFLLYDMPLVQALSLALEVVTDLGIRISIFYMILAAADYIFQKTKFSRDMRMTKQEIKEEFKQSEGDPQVKGKIKQKMREASQRRMMQDIPKADVVITNPTHYAVAIKYDPDKYDAPYVLAKGENYLAQRIKEIAKENEIEIVENKPLARMLYANVEIGGLVPPELYQAVAEVQIHWERGMQKKTDLK